MRNLLFIVFLILPWFVNYGQTLGGNSVFNFLKLSNTPQLTALGGINISNQSNDIGLVFNNPSLLRPSMHTQVNLVFNSFFAGIKNFHLLGGFYRENIKTSFAGGINYFHYGSLTETDASGNVLGELKPADYVVQVMASRQYLTKWYYGATLKFIHSNYGQYRSSGLALDIGAAFVDSSHLLQVSWVAKNMGTQVKAYYGTQKDDLPFDLELAISKKLAKAPLQFSLTAHHLQQFDIRYDDTAFDNANGAGASAEKSFILDKLFRHLVFATQLYIDDKVEISIGYNYLRRKEMDIGSAGNGLNGFSSGVGVLIKKFQVRYAFSYYQGNRTFHQFGLNLKLNEYFDLGNK